MILAEINFFIIMKCFTTFIINSFSKNMLF